MKKLILIAGLMIISLQAKLCAQTIPYELQKRKSNAELTFSGTSVWVNIRNVITLKEGKLILELTEPDDYKAFGNFDSLLKVFMKDIAFYKDSLAADPTSHVRIDYVINSEYSFKKIRFKKYHADGDIYMNRDGEIARLKFEEDTVHFIIQKSKPGFGRKGMPGCQVNYNVRATFVIGNYTDIDKIIADNVLSHAMDTIESTTRKYAKKHWKIYDDYSSTYNPYYSGRGNFLHYDFLIGDKMTVGQRYSKHKFDFVPQVGATLVRNTITPMTEIGFRYNRYFSNFSWQNYISVSASGLYFFAQDAKGDFIVNDNWFVNASLGAIYDKEESSWSGIQPSIGVGYLVAAKGGYFKNNTFRLYTDLKYKKGITIVPELIFTNDFKQIFPGITVKFF